MNKDSKIGSIAETGLFTAIVFIGIFIIKIPCPGGYAHIGDSMIFLSVIFLGGKRGAVAGGLGAGIADIISGYAVWALPSLICKALMALVMGAMIEHRALGLGGRPLWIVSALCGGIVQGVGYFATWWLMFDKAAAFAAVGGLLFQVISGIIITLVLTEAFNKTSLRNKFVYDISQKKA